MNKICTSIEQSEKLMELGVSLDTADMYYEPFLPSMNLYLEVPSVASIVPYSFNGDLPAWSLTALLGLLPEIQGGKPVIALDDNFISYPHIKGAHVKGDNLVDAAYDMIVWLIENKYGLSN